MERELHVLGYRGYNGVQQKKKSDIEQYELNKYILIDKKVQEMQ